MNTILFAITTLLLGLGSTQNDQQCVTFPIVDLGYAKHAPTKVNATSLHNISYATYANIRFAQPPVGDLRFRAPKVPPPFNASVQNGIHPRNSTDCINSITPGLAIAPGVEGITWGSEDCLFLDVKVPEGIQGGKVPVLHWLYGGGYTFGSKDWAGNPAALFQTMSPEQKFIAVSSNYRLGNLGWMSSDDEDMVKNAGLWDALAALEWTREYISYFRGDPDDITLIGESAGSGMGQHLVTAWGGEKEVPFNKAILTSPGYRPHVNRSADMTGIYKLFLNSSGCQDVACLRSLPTEAIVAANQDLLFNIPSSGWLGPLIGYGPVLDGDLVPDLPDRLLQEGKYQKSVERVLTANMANDGLYNTVLQATNWSEHLSYFMATPTQSAIDAVSSVYPSNLTVAFNLFSGDVTFACHAYWTAAAFSSHVYRYSMSIPPATHGQDQFYYLYNGPADDVVVAYPNVALELQSRFRTFLFEGRTGGDGCNTTHWPAYGRGGRWMNITTEGFDLVQNEQSQAQRCELVMQLINDVANGW